MSNNEKRVYKQREFEKLLEKNGYIKMRTKGGHVIYGNGKKTIAIPYKNTLNRMMVKRLIKENKLKL